MDGGTYTLLVELTRADTITFGASGDRDLSAGVYAYTGSALGPGGFSRVDRHHRLASGEHDARHWHVDYLLGHPDSRIRTVVRSPGADVECRVARALSDADGVTPISGLGASDCSCDTHLHHGEYGRLLDAVRAAHRDHA